MLPPAHIVRSATLLIALLSARTFAAEALPPDFFKSKIAPVFTRCAGCHGKDDPAGELNLTERAAALKGGDHGAAFVPGKSAESLLFKQVSDGIMPPKKKGLLQKEQLDALRVWLDAGAPWEGTLEVEAAADKPIARAGKNWWSLQPLARPQVPVHIEAKDSAWTANPIDAFVFDELAKKKLRPAPPATKAALIRRATFDLTGLPPTPEAIDAFIDDNAPDAYEKLIDRLLASPQYGERWGRHRLDVVRFCESDGFEYDKYRENAWPYRDYVVQSFNADKPYAQFIREQLAGDVLDHPTRESITATGFLTCGPWDMVGQSQASKVMRARVREDDLEDVVSAVSQTFFGMTVNCARCHNHKFDPIPQKDYYRIKAVFEGVQHGDRPGAPPGEIAAREKESAALAKKRAELESRIRALEDKAATAVAAAKKDGAPKPPTGIPAPVARWSFSIDARDDVSGAASVLVGNAFVADGRLHLEAGGAFLRSAPIAREIRDKSLEAWVHIPDLKQRGGSVLTLEALDQRAFDALVFGEREERKWMAGSEFYTRSKNLEGPLEASKPGEAVHVAAVYSADNSIQFYRNGAPYGTAYTPANPLQTFPANTAHVLIGLRHTGVGNGQFTGEIDEARLYDRALSAAEIAASFKAGTRLVSPEELRAALGETDRREWDNLAHQRDVLRAERDALKPIPVVYAANPRQPEPTALLDRGDPEKRGEIVAPGALSSVSAPNPEFNLAPDAPEAARRRALAEWVADAKNPLTARVLVNRIWQGHFGRGIVGSPNDFGFNGERPTHPQLLDWLAAEFLAGGGKIKALQKQIMLSNTYRQSSRFDPAAAAIDADNKLLWRGPARRLEAEAVRDAMLAISGQIDFKSGGPGFRSFKAADANRRSVYYVNALAAKNPFLETLDCPDPSVKTPRRLATTTPLQALTLMNNPFIWEQAKHFAERVAKTAGQDRAAQIQLAWRLALGRSPKKDEADAGLKLAREHGLEHLCWVLFNTSEFLYVN